MSWAPPKGQGQQAKKPRDNHLTDEFTSRDLFGFVRGACRGVSKGRQVGVSSVQWCLQQHAQRLPFAVPWNALPLPQCNNCGRYLKATAEYTISPAEKVGSRPPGTCPECMCVKRKVAALRGRWRKAGPREVILRTRTRGSTAASAPSQQGRIHPDNDPGITACSRCRCPADAHEVLQVCACVCA